MSLEAITAALAKGAGWLPFFALATNGEQFKPSLRSIVEAIIIAGLIAAFQWLAIIPRIEERIELKFEAVTNRLEANESRIMVHQSNGHPFTVIERIKGVETRVNRLENAHDKNVLKRTIP